MACVDTLLACIILGGSILGFLVICFITLTRMQLINMGFLKLNLESALGILYTIFGVSTVISCLMLSSKYELIVFNPEFGAYNYFASANGDWESLNSDMATLYFTVISLSSTVILSFISNALSKSRVAFLDFLRYIIFHKWPERWFLVSALFSVGFVLLVLAFPLQRHSFLPPLFSAACILLTLIHILVCVNDRSPRTDFWDLFANGLLINQSKISQIEQVIIRVQDRIDPKYQTSFLHSVLKHPLVKQDANLQIKLLNQWIDRA